jgi:putative sugar O-methyltransferase
MTAAINDRELSDMFTALEEGNPVFSPSKFWRSWSEKNVNQIKDFGIENFKQTAGTNYFTWTVGSPFSNHFTSVARLTSLADWPSVLAAPFSYESSPHLKRMAKLVFPMLTRMVWLYTKRRDPEGLLNQLEEPLIGNPFKVYYKGRLISQELAYTALEYYAVREHFKPDHQQPITIGEIGAGGGRVAFFYLSVFPKARYVIVDIPPTLYVSQYYLSSVFPRKKIFKARQFKSYGEVKEEIEQADIVFLLPHQIEMLPDKSFDLFMNISSFQEMRMDTISAYLQNIDRLSKGFFYSKQWNESVNDSDQIKITQKDYPIPRHWREMYVRECPEETKFFESLYQIGT